MDTAPSRIHPKSCIKCGFDPNIPTNEDDVRILPARVEALLQSNDPPLESELTFICEARRLRTERLSTLDQQIVEAKATLDSLKKERVRVAKGLKDMRILSSPIRRVPTDILSEVFLACREPETPLDFPHGADSLDLRRAPWILLRVCSRWRNIGTSLPSLWSMICIDLDKMLNPLLETSQGSFFLGRYLQLSGTSLLSIWVRSTEYAIPDDYSLLQVLVPTSYRWKFAAFSIDLASFDAFSSIRGYLQALRVLSIRDVPGYDVDEEAAGTLDLFEFAPLLSDLRILGVRDISTRFILPWSQLIEYLWLDTDEDHGDTPLPNHLDALRRTPDLRVCELQCGVGTVAWQAGPPLVLDKLWSLILVDTYRGCSELMRHLSLPRLTELDLEEMRNVDGIVSLLNRSQCQLSTLQLTSTYFPEEGLLRLIRAAPTIKQLDIYNHNPITSRIVKQMTFRPEQPGLPLLPALLRLELPNLACKVGCLVEMLDSRCGNAEEGSEQRMSCLEHLHFRDPIDLPPLLLATADKYSHLNITVGNR